MKKIPNWIKGRFMIDPETGCWRWLGKRGSPYSGYAQTKINGKLVAVYRVLYEEMVGPIPEGYQIDHVHKKGCRYRSCINPDHLEAVTPKVNTQRYHDLKKTCPKGHPKTSENIYITPNGARSCRRCRIANQRRWVAENYQHYRDLVNRSQRKIRARKKESSGA